MVLMEYSTFTIQRKWCINILRLSESSSWFI